MGESEPHITVEHSQLKDSDGNPVRSRVPEAAFDVAGGWKSRGWKRVKPATAAKERG